jgi:hypothetical protein
VPKGHPHGVVADGEDGLEFVEGGVRVLADMGGELDGIELTPAAPSGLGGEGVGLGGGKVAIDGAFPQGEAPRGLGPRAAGVDELHDPFPQIQRVGFHAHSLPPILPMSM